MMRIRKYDAELLAKDLILKSVLTCLLPPPPLAAKKSLFSLATTEGIGYKNGNKAHGMKFMFIDITRAYYYAKARRRIFIQLPDGDREPGTCGVLNMSLQGTRDAAQNLEFEYSEFLTSIGFTKGRASPCLFFKKQCNLRLAVHGDDFTLLGPINDLHGFQTEIKKKFETKVRGIIGCEPDDDKSIRILNRVIEWTDRGIEYEADQRHAEIIVRDAKLGHSAKSVNTPGIKSSATLEGIAKSE